ncbi:MAG TPA: aminotransferase class IV [Candidatus Brocadiia bacterium]|nr:aminotransferase class IV [Candidatus Brocadiia bacterium]
MGVLWINGEFVDESRPVILAGDRGFLYGDGLFETMRTFGGKVFQLAEHWARLAESAEFLRIPLGMSADEAGAVAEELARRNGLQEAVIRAALSRGPGGRGLGLVEPERPTLMIQARPLEPMPEEIYRRGMDLIVASARQNANSPLARHKTANYLLCLLARQEARDAKRQEAVILNQMGQVCEASAANIFWVEGGRLVTPAVHCGLLPGVTRASVLRIAGRLGIETAEVAAPVSRLFDAEEALLTNSVMGVMPVRRLDDRRVGAGAPGPVTRRIMEAYADRGAWA